MMTYYVTVSKSCLFYFWFCSEPARGQEGVDSSRDYTFPSSVAGPEGAWCVSHF